MYSVFSLMSSSHLIRVARSDVLYTFPRARALAVVPPDRPDEKIDR